MIIHMYHQLWHWPLNIFICPLVISYRNTIYLDHSYPLIPSSNSSLTHISPLNSAPLLIFYDPFSSITASSTHMSIGDTLKHGQPTRSQSTEETDLPPPLPRAPQFQVRSWELLPSAHWRVDLFDHVWSWRRNVARECESPVTSRKHWFKASFGSHNLPTTSSMMFSEPCGVRGRI